MGEWGVDVWVFFGVVSGVILTTVADKGCVYECGQNGFQFAHSDWLSSFKSTVLGLLIAAEA